MLALGLPKRHSFPDGMEDAILLDRLNWSPSIDEINNAPERLLNYLIIWRAVRDAYVYNSTIDF